MFEFLPRDIIISITTILSQDIKPFYPQTFKSLLNLSQTCRNHRKIFSDQGIWKPIVKMIASANGYDLDDNSLFFGFEDNTKELASILVQDNFRTYFINWPYFRDARNWYKTKSMGKLTSLVNTQKGINLLIRVLLAELCFIDNRFRDCRTVCLSISELYPGVTIFLDFLSYSKINNLFFKPESIISLFGPLTDDHPLKPYEDFSCSILEALVINYIKANKVLITLVQQAKFELRKMLFLIKSTAVLSLMECYYYESVITTLGIEKIIRYDNYLSAPEFHPLPPPSFLFLICNDHPENIIALDYKANEFFPAGDMNRYNTVFKSGQCLYSIIGFLRLRNYFNSIELMEIAAIVYDENLNAAMLPHLCNMSSTEFQTLIVKLLEFRQFYAQKIGAEYFDFLSSISLHCSDKLDILKKESMIPLIKGLNLDKIKKLDRAILLKFSSVVAEKIINSIDYHDLLRVKENHFDQFNIVCNFEEGKIFKKRWITVNQFLMLSKERKNLLINLLPFISEWKPEQFRLILNIERSENNPFKDISILNKMLEYIPSSYGFNYLKSLIKSKDLLEALEKIMTKPNCIKVVLRELELKNLKKALKITGPDNRSLLDHLCLLDSEKCEEILKKSNKDLEELEIWIKNSASTAHFSNWSPSYWQKQETENNKNPRDEDSSVEEIFRDDKRQRK